MATYSLEWQLNYRIGNGFLRCLQRTGLGDFVGLEEVGEMKNDFWIPGLGKRK
jgi:hypothetical protein